MQNSIASQFPSGFRTPAVEEADTETVAGIAVERTALERKIELCECMIDIASAMFNVSGRELRKPGRSALPVSRVRQIAMYAAHVTLGLNMTDVGTGFGRDRTTVMHACHVIEDMRDDKEFDTIVASFERVAGAALKYRGVGNR